MERIKRLFPNTEENFFLFGPRGTGKTTWLKENYQGALFIDLLLERYYYRFQSNPELLLDLIDGNPDKKTIVIDEVQRIPELLSLIHHRMQKESGRQFILTGSSSRKLKRAGVDLLAGRALLKHFHPFTAWELKDEFNLDSALQFGLLPLVLAGESPDEVLGTYASLYLREEVQMEGMVRNITHFSRFMETMSFSHGQVLNLSEIARDCGTGRKAVEAYTQILEDLLIAYQIPVFTKRAKRRTIRHNKFYYFDAGIFRELRPRGPLDRPDEIDGPALEGLVLQHLLAWNDYLKKKASIYFWRTQAGREVDFVVYGESTFMAVEVRNSNRIRTRDLGGLKGFLEDYPEATPYLVYRGDERLLIEGIRCIPAADFLMELPNL